MDATALFAFIQDKGFLLVFAVWALLRLDKFLRTLVENEVRENEILTRIVDMLDRRDRNA